MANNYCKKSYITARKRIGFISIFLILITMIFPPGNIDKNHETGSYMMNNKGVCADSETENLQSEEYADVSEKPDNDEPSGQNDDTPIEGNDDETPTNTAVDDYEEEISEEGIGLESITTNKAIDIETEDAAIPQALTVTGGSASVSSFSDLKQVLENNNGVNNVFLTSNIVAASGGLDIHPSKGTVMISGLNSSGTNYTYTEISNGYANSIRMALGGKLIVEDLNIYGRSNYGPFTVSNNNQLTDTSRSITFNRVNYFGPRLVYMLGIPVQIIDSSIEIQTNSGGDSARDAVEASQVSVGGNTTISKNVGTYGIFGLYNYYNSPQNPKLLIEPNANVTINGNSNLITTGTTDYSTEFVVSENASFIATMSGTLAFSNASSTFTNPASYQRLDSLNVEENAVFKYKHIGGSSYSTVVVKKSIVVDTGATFDIRRTAPSSGLPVSNLLISVEDADSIIDFNNPERVILINGISTDPTVLAFMRNGNVYLKTKVINQWDSLPPFLSDIDSEDTVDWSAGDIPTGRWNMKSQREISLNVYIFSNSFSPYYIMDYSSYTPASSRNTDSFTEENLFGLGRSVFTLGEHFLDVNEIFENDNIITGTTSPNSDLQIAYNTFDGQTLVNSEDSDNTGSFETSVSKRMEADSEVVSSSHNRFLMAYMDETVQPSEGELSFYEVPQTLPFGNHTATIYEVKGRVDPDWAIKVQDTRSGINEWSLYVSSDSPLTASRGGIVSQLPNVLCFLEGYNLHPIISTPVVAYEGETSPGAINGITSITWEEDQGPVIALSPQNIDDVMMNALYSTDITWTLVSGP